MTPYAEFRIMRQNIYGGDHATVGFIHAKDEADLLRQLHAWALDLDHRDSLVGVNGPALTMLLEQSVKKGGGQ